MATAHDALNWMISKAASPNTRMLFRGQNCVYPSIKPSITRLDEQTMVEMWNICQRFHTAARGVTGYLVESEHDRLAILQHYIGRSPVIDLTGTPAVALYFALLNAQPGDLCVVYAVKPDACDPQEVVFSDHAFLLLKPQQGGFSHRWLRQDGYSVGPRNWRDLNEVRNFDLLSLPGVESKCFIKRADDAGLISHLGNLEDISSDPLAGAVRGVVDSVSRSLDLITPGLQAILSASKTRDLDSELADEIDELITLAHEVGAPDKVLMKLQNLRSSVGSTYWDTSFDCALDWARGEVSRLASRSA